MVSDIYKIGFLLLALFGCNGIQDRMESSNHPGRPRSGNPRVARRVTLRNHANLTNVVPDVVLRARASVEAAKKACKECDGWTQNAIRARDEAKAAAGKGEWNSVIDKARLVAECNVKASRSSKAAVEAADQVSTDRRKVNPKRKKLFKELLRLEREANKHRNMAANSMLATACINTELSDLLSQAC